MKRAPGQRESAGGTGGPAPENFTGTLRRYGPDLVLMVDAALMDLEPGTDRLVELAGYHRLQRLHPYTAVASLASYLTSELHCEVALLGIQPAQCQVGAPSRSKVQDAAENVARGISKILEVSGKS